MVSPNTLLSNMHCFGDDAPILAPLKLGGMASFQITKLRHGVFEYIHFLLLDVSVNCSRYESHQADPILSFEDKPIYKIHIQHLLSDSFLPLSVDLSHIVSTTLSPGLFYFSGELYCLNHHHLSERNKNC